MRLHSIQNRSVCNIVKLSDLNEPHSFGTFSTVTFHLHSDSDVDVAVAMVRVLFQMHLFRLTNRASFTKIHDPRLLGGGRCKINWINLIYQPTNHRPTDRLTYDECFHAQVVVSKFWNLVFSALFLGYRMYCWPLTLFVCVVFKSPFSCNLFITFNVAIRLCRPT